MRLTVIPSDNVIILDGEVLKFSYIADPNIHAIQWYGAHGYIEYVNGNQVKTVDAADVQSFVAAFNAEKARLAAPKPPKTPAELEMEASNLAKVALAKITADALPDMLAFIAALPGAPLTIKNAAALAVIEKGKIK